MSGEQRLLLSYEMSLFARELSRERIRHEHPNGRKRALLASCAGLPSFLRRCPPACNELS
jgi:hypothetical protein